jgi:hypothetical protein
MKFSSIIILILLSLSSCKNTPEIDTNSEYSNLKDNQTRVKLKVDNKEFYELDAVFQGNIDVRKNFLSMNCFNQYGGNLMLTLDGESWYKKKSIEGKGGLNFSSLMFGKVTDKEKHKGDGYLLNTGNIEPITISKSKLVLRVSGIAKKFPRVNAEDPSYNFECYIISKNPVCTEFSVPE